MEETINTSAENREAVDTGAAGSSPVTGDTLFERFEDGASIEELNEMLAQPEAADVQEKTSGIEDDKRNSLDDERQTGAPEAATDALGKRRSKGADEGKLGAPKRGSAFGEKEEQGSGVDVFPKGKTEQSGLCDDVARTFTQRDVDYLIGKKTSDVTRKHSALIDDLAAILGVDRSNVVGEVRRQRLEAEAEQKGVADKELYAQKRELEEQNRALAQAQAEEQAARAFSSTMQRQGAELSKSVPDFDMASALMNPQFEAMLVDLYKNPTTRDNALRLAYNAVYFEDMAKRIAQNEKEKVVASVRSGAARVSEGAQAGSPAASARLDVSRLSDDQIDKISRGILEGRIRNLEDLGGI